MRDRGVLLMNRIEELEAEVARLKEDTG